MIHATFSTSSMNVYNPKQLHNNRAYTNLYILATQHRLSQNCLRHQKAECLFFPPKNIRQDKAASGTNIPSPPSSSHPAIPAGGEEGFLFFSAGNVTVHVVNNPPSPPPLLSVSPAHRLATTEPAKASALPFLFPPNPPPPLPTPTLPSSLLLPLFPGAHGRFQGLPLPRPPTNHFPNKKVGGSIMAR